MSNKGFKNVTLQVDNEQNLYNSLSPEPEFTIGVIAYVKSRIIGKDVLGDVRITVVSEKPIDEEKFRIAAGNWVQRERELLQQENKRLSFIQALMLGLSVLFLLVHVMLESVLGDMPYDFFATIGTFCMGQTVAILVTEIPKNRIKKSFLRLIAGEYELVFEVRAPREETIHQESAAPRID